MIRPQSVQQKKHNAMILSLKKNDKVLTRGGIIGSIIDIKGKDSDILVIDSGNNSKITIKKSYIIKLLN